VNIDQLRADLQQAGLPEDIKQRNPFELLDEWMAFAAGLDFFNPTAMALSTVDADGFPSVRNVLMRGVVDGGLAFYTNLNSPKGVALRDHPYAETLFSWLDLDRQIRVRGPVRQLTDEQSDRYFASRPRASRLAALASDQSAVIPNRAWLMKRYKTLVAAHDGIEVERPEGWGGFALVPERFEFWQGAEFRLHDRVAFDLVDGQWSCEQLAP